MLGWWLKLQYNTQYVKDTAQFESFYTQTLIILEGVIFSGSSLLGPLSVLVRLAHIEDGCGDSLEEKRDGLYSTETWLCACIIENERLRRCRLPHHKRGA